MTLDEMIGKTGKRQASFNMMMNHLNKQSALIVETGCAREENNFDGDGMSTLIFDEYIKQYGGTFFSVDINPDNTAFAKSKCELAKIHTGDSVEFLYNFPLNRKIDLLYLDSYDFDPQKPHPSSLHHLKELTAIMPSLQKGTMIVVDDNFLASNDGGKTTFELGKGQYVKEFMDSIGIQRTFAGYQWVWIL